MWPLQSLCCFTQFLSIYQGDRIMGDVEDIVNKVEEYLDTDYEAINLSGIPTIDNIGFGKKVYTRSLTTFSIDLRKSTQLLFDHHRKTVAKIHKAFLTAITMTIKKYGGEVRDFQGDGILAFWDAQFQYQIRNAVRAAFAIRWLISIKLAKYFKKYENQLNYTIGVDFGDVCIARVGIKRNVNYNGLIYVGKSVNFAVAMSNDQSSSPKIMISTAVYNNLDNDHILSKKRENMWKDGSLVWNGKRQSIKHSTYYWGF